MKKNFICAAFFIAACAFSFADTIWHFESGSEELNYRYFSKIVVHNKTGKILDVDGQYLYNNSSATFYKDSILISSDAYNSNEFEAFYSLKNGELQVTLGKQGRYGQMREVEVPLILPPPPPPRIRHDPPPHHNNPPPVKQQPPKRKDPPPATPKRKDPPPSSGNNSSKPLERPRSPKK